MIDIENAFNYKPANATQKAQYESLRENAKRLAVLFRDTCPPSPELDNALRRLEESLFWANAGVARN